jgi:hypothetical protein
MLDGSLRRGQIGREVHGNLIIEIGILGFGQSLGRHRGIYHRHVDAAQKVGGCIEKRLHTLASGKIDVDAASIPYLANARKGIVEMLGRSSTNKDPRAFRCKKDRNRPADARGATGHHGITARKTRLLRMGVGAIEHVNHLCSPRMWC